MAALKQGLDMDGALAIPGDRHQTLTSAGRRSNNVPGNIDFIELIQDELDLSTSHVDQLRRDGVILRRIDGDFSFPAAYHSIYVRDLPLLVTADSILHAVHRSFDEILNETENYMIRPELALMLERAHAELAKVDADAAPEELRDSLNDVDVYLTVARSLLAGRPNRRHGVFK